jgi:hypothetical protein
MQIHDDGVTVTIIMTTDDYFALEAIAGENNESISWITWQAIRQYIDRARAVEVSEPDNAKVTSFPRSRVARGFNEGS